MSGPHARAARRRARYDAAIERLIEEFEGQGCQVFEPPTDEGARWDLVVLSNDDELRMVWSERVLRGGRFALYLANVGDGARSTWNPAQIKARALRGGLVPLVCTHYPDKPERDRWTLEVLR